MRLIDVDNFKKNNPEYLQLDIDYVTEVTVEDVLDCEPTVEAIPIEWILKRAKLCTADYANCLHYLVEAWQTEQKYMVNGQWKFPKDWEKENETNRQG